MQTDSTANLRSHYVTQDTARRAVGLAAPMIEQALHDRNVVASGFLYVIIMDPALTPANASFEQAVLYEHAFGDCALWEADYAGFARAKANLSWSLERDSHALAHTSPHLLRQGDSATAGGVCLDGLVVAASGALPVYDEVFAGTVALCLRALARKARENEATTAPVDSVHP